MTEAEFYESFAITYEEWEASLNQAQEEHEAEHCKEVTHD